MAVSCLWRPAARHLVASSSSIGLMIRVVGSLTDHQVPTTSLIFSQHALLFVPDSILYLIMLSGLLCLSSQHAELVGIRRRLLPSVFV